MAPKVNIQYVQFYTSGSAAKKVAPAISVHTGALPQIKKRKLHRVYVDPVATFGIVVALCMLVMMLVGVSQLHQEQNRIAYMEQQVEMLSVENERLQSQYEAEMDLESVEEIALALGMIPQQDAVNSYIHIEVPETQGPDHITLWNRIGTFLTGLFA